MMSNRKLEASLVVFLALAALALLFGCLPEGSHHEAALPRSAVESSDAHNHAPRQDEHGEDEHGHDEEEHGQGEEKQVVRLSAADMKEFDIEVQTAGPGRLDQYVELPGEIVLNADRLAHVPPRLRGIVRKTFNNLGDQVEAGETLALIESRELADAKAEFLAARERLALANASFKREENLWKEKISAEKRHLEARNAVAERRIALSSAKQKLHALGFSDTYVKKLPQNHRANFTHYKIRAPISGTIIEKHITVGETVAHDANTFTIADLSTVWVNINVYQKDLIKVRKGQEAVIEVGHGIPGVTGEIVWVGPLLGETTRTAKARMVLSNADGNLRPGQFITAKVAVNSIQVAVRVPKTALQTMDERTVVFVQTEEGFTPQPIETGPENNTHVEIVSGLRADQTYVSRGAFTLKAQLSKGAFGDGHNH